MLTPRDSRGFLCACKRILRGVRHTELLVVAEANCLGPCYPCSSDGVQHPDSDFDAQDGKEGYAFVTFIERASAEIAVAICKEQGQRVWQVSSVGQRLQLHPQSSPPTTEPRPAASAEAANTRPAANHLRRAPAVPTHAKPPQHITGP